MTPEIIIIHGGNSYLTHSEYIAATKAYTPRFKDGYRDWKTNLVGELEGLYTVLNPIMPCKDNSKFEEWKIVFDKVLDMCGKDIILIGHSLGANFLQYYLGQFAIDKTIHQLHFVAGCISEGDFQETSNWVQLQQSSPTIHIWHSEDDPFTPYQEAVYYNLKLKDSTLHTFTNRKHITQPYFPELTSFLVNSITE
jgi:predicted alpha/beta hydrolase family esterase